MSKSIVELAREMSPMFEWRKRENGDDYVVLKDGHPEWMTDIIRKAHDNGELLPNDTTYRFIEAAIDTIADCEDDASYDDIGDRLCDIESDVYTSDLTEWLHASNYHVDYLTQAAEEYGITDGFQLLAAAQGIHRREVAYAVMAALGEMAEELAA